MPSSKRRQNEGKTKATFQVRLSMNDHIRVESAFNKMKNLHHIGDTDRSFLMCCVGIINKEGDLK